MASADDLKYMNIAFQQAEKGRGITAPNPLVGAVLVKNKRILAIGYHKGPGKPHAEAVVIKKAKEQARNATLYVNLEPCCHQGRTGPCTDTIIKAGIKKVITATPDPFNKVNGKGFKVLRKAGIKVETSLMKNEARRLNDAYFGYIKNKRPYIILKLGQTLDGRIATSSGESKYISSPESLKFVHRLRSDVDAVMIGSNTARTDNPMLTVRRFKGINPYRIIMSRRLNLPTDLKLLKNNSDIKTILASSERSIKRFIKDNNSSNLIFFSLDTSGKENLDLNDFVSKACEFGFRSILIEGGSKLAASFIKAKLVDKIIITTSPIILGQGINAIADFGVKKLTGALKLKESTVLKSGDDLITIGYPDWKK